jgi:branched-subunit amino acid transport protein
MSRPWLVIAAMGIGTLGIRVSMILLLGRLSLSARALRALHLVPPAVFSALVAPALVRPQGPVDLGLANPYLLAGLLAWAVAWRGGGILAATAAGMAALVLLR